jgi:hypothetical protein
VEDIRIGDLLLEPAAPGVSSPARRGGTHARLFETLLAGRRLPTACGTPLLIEARRHLEELTVPVRETIRSLGVRPFLSREEIRLTRDGRFAIHFTTAFGSPDAVPFSDADFNGVPDRVDRAEAALQRAAKLLAGEGGWPLPNSVRTDRLDVYFADLGPLRGGAAVPERELPATSRDDAAGFLLLDARLDGDPLASEAVHQFAHASLMALAARTPAWWAEGTASYLETLVTGDPSPRAAGISHRLRAMDRTLAGDTLLLAEGGFLWASFLAERREQSPGALRNLWEDAAGQPGEGFLAVLDRLLRRDGGEGLHGSYREFTRWILFTGARDDGEHFLFGRLLPPLLPRSSHSVFPADSAGFETVEPLGVAVVHLLSGRSRGGLRLRFEAEPGSRLEVDLVITPSEPGARPHLVEVPLDPAGRAQAGLPWREVSEAFLLIRNPAADAGPARFRYAAEVDPGYPYDLSSLTATAARRGASLEWSTLRETDVLGWNVYRSSSAAGPFLRINPITLPSGGDSEEETRYVYLDDSASPGGRYFYLLEAITILGLPDRTPPVSIAIGETSSFP